MTDNTTPLSDEDLSAYLDGEGPAHADARLADDPAARARLAQLRAAAETVAAARVEPLPPQVVDSLVSVAVAGSPEAADLHSGQRPPDPGVDGIELDGEPADDDGNAIDHDRRDDEDVIVMAGPARPSRRAPPMWLVAAAVVVLVAVGAGLIWTGVHQTHTDTAARFDTVGSAKSPGAKAANGAATGSGSAGRPSASPGLVPRAGPLQPIPPTERSPSTVAPTPLGTFTNPAALRKALAAKWPATYAADGTTAGATQAAGTDAKLAASSRCAGQIEATLSLAADPVHTGSATVGSRPVLVYEFAATASAEHRATVVAVGVAACDPVLIFVR